MNHTEGKNNDRLLIFGGSAGSLDVLLTVIPTIQPVNTAIVIVVHRKDEGDNLLVELMASRSGLPVKEAEDKEVIKTGMVYIAPPDYHLLIEKEHTFALDLSEKVNFSRPSIDVTLETAADAYGKQLVAVLLSGANTDGAAGMKKVMEMDGTTIVQDPSSAAVAFMPKHALSVMTPSKVLTTVMLADFLKSIL